MGENLRVFFFSDWRIQPLQLLERMLEETAPVDVVLYGGDDIARLTDSPAYRFPGWRELWEHLRQSCARQSVRKLTLEQRELAKAGYWFGDPEKLVNVAAQFVGRQPERPLRPDGGHKPGMLIARVLTLFAPQPETHWLAGLGRYARYGVGAVIGNDCLPEHVYRLEMPALANLHQKPLRAGDWGVAGIQGAISLLPAGSTERLNAIGRSFTPDEGVYAHLERARSALDVPGDQMIVVSHTPPAGCLDVGIRWGFDRLGSPALAAYIDEHRPPLVLSGHCHSCGGRSVVRGNTLIVNAACSDTDAKLARAALIEMQPGSAADVRWLDPSPHSVLYFPGIGAAREEKLRAANITRVPELLQAEDGVLLGAGFGAKMLTRVRGRRLALETGSAVFLGGRLPEFPRPVIFFDVETGLAAPSGPYGPPQPQDPWLIAAKLGGSGPVHQWIAPEQTGAQRREMFEGFMGFLGQHPDAVLCSWTSSRFDARAVEVGLMLWCPRLLRAWEANSHFSPLTDFSKAFVLPTLNWKLETVARFCGHDGPPSELDGFLVGMLYELYRRKGEPLPVEQIAQYNRQDILSLEHVVTWFEQHGPDLPRVDPIQRLPNNRHVPLSAERVRGLLAAAPAGFRVCPQCGETFFPRYGSQVYCNKVCGEHARTWRKAQRSLARSG